MFASIRSTGRIAGVTLLLLMATGCHRRPKVPPLPAQAQAPIPLATPPEPARPPVVEPQPLPPMPTVAVKSPKKPRKRTQPAQTAAPATPPPPAAAATIAPVQVASAEPPPAASVIGSLTTGDDASPEKRQQAAAMLAGIDKRLKELPVSVAEAQKTQVARVRNFLQQAKVAFDSGDLDGAMTLATKARLLLDDLTK